MEKKKIGGIAIVSTVAASMLLTGCGEAKKIEKYFEDGDYSEAVDLFESKELSSKELAKVTANMKTHLTEAIEQYANDEISYKKASKIVNTVIKLEIDEISSETLEATEELQELYNSKTAYDEAKSYEEGGDMLEAYKDYKLVIEKDCNYADASAKAAQIKEEYLASAKADIQAYVDNGQYAEAITLCQRDYEASEMEELKNLHDNLCDEYLQSIYSSVEQYINDKDYDSALRVLRNEKNRSSVWTEEKIAEIQAKYDETEAAYEYYKYETYRDEQTGYANNEFADADYRDGFYYLDRIYTRYTDYATNDQVYQQTVTDMTAAFVKAARDEAKTYIDACSYKKAIWAVNNYIAIRSSDELTAYVEELTAKSPVYLCDLVLASSNGLKQYETNRTNTITSSLGKEYYQCEACYTIEEKEAESYSSAIDGYATFETDGQYTKLSGLLDTVGGEIIYPEEETAEEEETTENQETTEGEETAENQENAENQETTENQESVENQEAADEQETADAGDVTETEPVDPTAPYSNEHGTFEIYGTYIVENSGENTETETTDAAAEGSENTENTEDTGDAENTEDAEVTDGTEERLLYSIEIDGTTEPVQIDLDITGAQSITFKFTHDTGEMYVLLPDWTVE